jgi:hypothetical protein
MLSRSADMPTLAKSIDASREHVGASEGMPPMSSNVIAH